MGAVNFSLDINLVREVKKKFALDIFVETGTFKGDTIENVKDIFKSIYSAEISNEYFKLASEKFNAFEHIKIFESNSPSFIKSLKDEFINKSVLFWLDAHWCVADHTGGEESQCPLIEELEAIGILNEESVIIIDDARLFLTVPPYPHEVSHWPSLNQIIKTLRNLSSGHEIMVLNDNIIFFPEAVKALIYEYAHRHSIDWLSILHKSRDYDNLKSQFDQAALQLKEKDDLIKKQDADQKEKDSLIRRHHKFAHELMDELKNRNIQFSTQWPAE